MVDISRTLGLFKDAFKGTALWTSLIILSGYVFMGSIIVVMMFNAFYIMAPLLGVFVVWLFIAYSAQREAKIKILRENAGRKVLLIELGEGEDMGEIIELKVKKITPFKLFTKEEQVKKEKLTEKEREMIKSMEKTEGKKDSYKLEEKKVRKNGKKKIEDKSKRKK